MKITIHLTRVIDSMAEGEELYTQILEHFTPDPNIHVNAIIDHNLKHPEKHDTNQQSNPFRQKGP